MENTYRNFGSLFLIRDHLHTRGEYRKTMPTLKLNEGSPPHTWRIRSLQNLTKQQKRITSTHVENTEQVVNRLLDHEDHLHTRGEYALKHENIAGKLGSPPHTWRILGTPSKNRTSFGITSTHVENTVNKSQYNNNHKTIDPKISSLCQLLLYLFLSH